MMTFKDMIEIRADLIARRLYGLAFKDLDDDRREFIGYLAEKDAWDKMLKLEEQENEI